jgi:hypothetical protein
MSQEGTGKILLVIGVAICLAGLLIWKFGDRLTWVGRLPGDVTYEGEHIKFYFPLTTLLLLNGIFWLLLKLKDWLFKD